MSWDELGMVDKMKNRGSAGGWRNGWSTFRFLASAFIVDLLGNKINCSLMFQ
jgi:hypothetical protein